MSFDWRPESKDRYFRKAEAAVKAAGFDDILQISKEQFAITKSTVKVYFKPIPREGKTRRWWEAKKSITGMQEQSGGRDEFGRKKKTIFIHAYMILEMEEQDRRGQEKSLKESDTCSRSRTANMYVCSANIMTCAKRRRKRMNMRYAKRSEDTEQINVVSWAGWNMSRYPELKWLFHVPNGGSRNKQEAVKFKQMGVKAGVSDLCLPYPKGSYCGLFVEMKFGNNRQQDTQKEFLADMAAAGHFVATCYSAEEAIKVIEEYLNLSDAVHMERNLNMSIPNNSILKDGKIKN